MPTTPNYAIRYPCAGSPVSLADFANLALDTEAAIAAVDIKENLALRRPAAAIRRNTGAFLPAVGVATTVTYDQELYDNANMADLAVNNDRLTIVRSGVYMVWGFGSVGGGATTVTSTALLFTRNGVLYAEKKVNAQPLTTSTSNLNGVAMVSCVAGDILRLQYLWTGTGGPVAPGVRLAARLVCLA